MQEMVVCLKISTASPCSMLEKVLMSMGEVNLGFRPALLPTKVQVILVDHQVSIFMVITEMDIGLNPRVG